MKRFKRKSGISDRIKSLSQTPASLLTLGLWHKKLGEHDKKFLYSESKIIFSYIHEGELVVMTLDLKRFDFFINGHSIKNSAQQDKNNFHLKIFLDCFKKEQAVEKDANLQSAQKWLEDFI